MLISVVVSFCFYSFVYLFRTLFHLSNLLYFSDIDEFRLAFQQGCPKFLSPTTVVYDGPNQAKVYYWLLK